MAAMNTLTLANVPSHSLCMSPFSSASNSCRFISLSMGRRRSFFNVKSSLRPSVITSPEEAKSKVELESTKTIEELQEKTRRTLQRELDPMAAMKLIDTLQWVGISYLFEEDIDFWLEKLQHWEAAEQDLHGMVLRFRLLRLNARPVSSDVFTKFIGKNQDREGLLSLYEASYLGSTGEDTLSKAMIFAESELKSSDRGTVVLPQQHLSERITRALELPRHMRIKRLESRLYMDEYSKQKNHNGLLLQLANLIIIRRLKQLGLTEKLSFARDRPMECFLWTVGIFPDPKYSAVRIEMAKTIAILWDLNAIEELPEYMKICYMALYNTTNEIAYKVLKQQGRNVFSFLSNVIDTIEAFMIEAEWFNNGHTTSIEDYLENGVTTSGSYMALVFAFFLMGEGINDQNVKYMVKAYPKIFSTSERIFRLWDDLGTAKEEQDRCDNASVITLLMTEKRLVSEEEAREHIMQLIHSLWKDLNTKLLGSNSLPLSLIKGCFNMLRTSQVIFQHQEDNYFSSVDKFVDFIILDPIKI